MHNIKASHFNPRLDIPASIVVFLVALPLCLGIALASGAPLFSGILTGIVGGLVVGFLSKSQLSVAGPAAGMTVIVINGISNTGGFEDFLVALVVAGVIQFLLGVLRFGRVGYLIPSSVIQGVMASIGLVLILKQIPHGLGYDLSYEGEAGFITSKGENTFTEIIHSFSAIHPGASLIFFISSGLLIALNVYKYNRFTISRFLPPALIVVLGGIFINKLLGTGWVLESQHLVNIPFIDISSIFDANNGFIRSPNLLDNIWRAEIYKTALVIALVGSIETLISVEATEKLDPHKRPVPLNWELKVHGIANTILGFIGGIPLTSVIVRSSANISAGGQSKYSTILQGGWLLLTAVFLTEYINQIPLASLASILIIVAYKLTQPAVYKTMYKHGKDRFLPFIITIVAIFFTDLLIGLLIGLTSGIIFTIKANFFKAIVLTQDKNNYLLKLAKDVSFLNKSDLHKTLNSIPNGAYVIIDGTKPTFIDADIIEIIEEYRTTAHLQEIRVELKTSLSSANEYFMKTM